MTGENEAAGDLRMPVGEIAPIIGISVRRIQQLVKDGWIAETPQHGVYSLADCVQGYIRFVKDAKRDTKRGTETSRLAAAQAVRVEMENYRRMGELQTTEQVMETCHGLVVMVKSAHAGLPGRLASEFSAISEPARIHRRIQDELRAVDAQCADFLEKRAAALEAMPDPRANYAPADPDDAEPMGGDESGDAGGLP